MTAGYRLTEAADQDIEAILGETAQRFGPVQFERYVDLFERAASLLADQPGRPSSRSRPDLGAGVRAFHLENAANRVGAASHIIYYHVDHEGVLVLRILHERMDPLRHLPPS